MIVLDPPVRWGQRATSHLLSDLPGQPGQLELAAFAGRLGLPAHALHLAGTDREHYDLPANLLEAADAAGAVRVGRSELARILRRKRGARGAGQRG